MRTCASSWPLIKTARAVARSLIPTWLLLACACNQVFDIRETQLRDGPPSDAPPQCPPIGTALQFSGVLVEAVARECRDYSFSASADRALAACADTSMFEEGEVDGSLMPATGLGTNILNSVYPRLSPEGDELFMKIVNENRIASYRRSTSGVWTRGADAYTSIKSLGASSPPSRGLDRRMLVVVFEAGSDAQIVELASQGAAWTPTGLPYSRTELVADSFGHPFLSEDGLRLFFASTDNTNMTRIRYADREQLSGRFRPIGEITGVPREGGYAHMTPDCGRYYLTRFGISFVPQ